MSLSVEVVSSNVRDFCMLEHNFLSHFKLALLLMLLSASALLGTRLSGPSGSEKETVGNGGLPAGIIQVIAALATIAAAVWEYHSGIKDLLSVRAFLMATRVHFSIMGVVTAVIVGTSVLYIVHSA